MVTKEELEKSTFIGRNANVWFMTAWALMMFIIDGVVYAVDPPPGESKWGYGPTVFLLCLVRGARRTNERRGEGESKRDRERRAKGGTNGDSRDATTKATGGANRNANANATARARSSEVYEETTRGATGDDEGRIGRIGRIIRDD